jgi:hypothetical protein
MRPSLQSFCTWRSEISQRAAASFTLIYPFIINRVTALPKVNPCKSCLINANGYYIRSAVICQEGAAGLKFTMMGTRSHVPGMNKSGVVDEQ